MRSMRNMAKYGPGVRKCCKIECICEEYVALVVKQPDKNS